MLFCDLAALFHCCRAALYRSSCGFAKRDANQGSYACRGPPALDGELVTLANNFSCAHARIGDDEVVAQKGHGKNGNLAGFVNGHCAQKWQPIPRALHQGLLSIKVSNRKFLAHSDISPLGI
jgi:hypothetical protein